MQLILASSSPFRKSVLEKLRLPFIQVSPNIDETAKIDESPQQLVNRLAIEKAQAVAKFHQNSLIIASDQVLVCDGRTFGKPGNHPKAIEQLQFLSGKTVIFYTSLVLMNTNTQAIQSHVDVTNVSFRDLKLKQIETYLTVDEPYNCAGSFKSEAFGVTLMTKIETVDPDALIGLPLLSLVSMLAQEGQEPLT